MLQLSRRRSILSEIAERILTYRLTPSGILGIMAADRFQHVDYDVDDHLKITIPAVGHGQWRLGRRFI